MTTNNITQTTTTAAATPFIRSCCRVCLAQESVMIYVYDRVEENDVTLAELLEICGGVTISKRDQYTKLICHECTTELILFAKFREKCQTSEKTLNKLVNTFSEKQLEKLIYCINDDDDKVIGKSVEDEISDGNGDDYDNNQDDDDGDDNSYVQNENIIFKESSEIQQNKELQQQSPSSEHNTIYLVPETFDSYSINPNNEYSSNSITTTDVIVKNESCLANDNGQDVYFDIGNDIETDAVIIDETCTDDWEKNDDDDDDDDDNDENSNADQAEPISNANEEQIFKQLIEECHLEQNADDDDDVNSDNVDDDGGDNDGIVGSDGGDCDDDQILYQSDNSSEMGHVIIENEPIKLKSPSDSPKVIINFSCKVCGAGFMHFINLKRHMYSHQQFKEIFTCDTCTIVFLSSDEYEEHIQDFHGDPLSSINQKNKDSNMENIIYDVHNEIQESNMSICEEDINNDQNLFDNSDPTIVSKKNHQTSLAKENIKISQPQIKIVNNKLTKTNKKSIPPSPPPFQSSSSSSSTPQQIMIGPSKKLHTCKYCERTFVSNSLLKVHERVHTGERPYQCENCSKTFTTRGGLDLHMRRHTGIKPFQCTTCQRRFVESSNLRVHMRIHTGEKPHNCNQCGRGFSRVFLLQIHQRTHTGERPYTCEHCGRAFSQQGDLSAHKRIHTGERPHKCDVCGKGFIKSSALTSHLRRHDKNFG